jgi:hypothetical protein
MPPPNNKEKIMVKDSDSIIVQGVKHYVQRYKFKFKGDYMSHKSIDRPSNVRKIASSVVMVSIRWKNMFMV